MHDIKCPHFNKALKIDEFGYSEILKQVRDDDFEKQLKERLELGDKEKINAVKLVVTLRELKHTYVDGNRVLSLLMIESAPPTARLRSGWEYEVIQDTFDLAGAGKSSAPTTRRRTLDSAGGEWVRLGLVPR